MIENAQVTPILPVADLSRATAFYRDKLGLKDLGDDANGQRLLQTGAGSTIGLMPAEEGAQTAHTVLTFEVDSVSNEIRDLERRGVGFLDYDTWSSRPSTTLLRWPTRRPRGSPTPRATSSACTNASLTSADPGPLTRAIAAVRQSVRC